MKKIFLFTMLALAISVAGSAQLINTKTISLEAAKKIVAESVKYAKANNAPGGAIAVVDAGGNLVYLERLDNTFPAASEVAIKKANTAAIFKAPSVRCNWRAISA